GRRPGVAPRIERLFALRVRAPRAEHALAVLSRLVRRDCVRAGPLPRVVPSQRALRRHSLPVLRGLHRARRRRVGGHLRPPRRHTRLLLTQGHLLLAEPPDPAAPHPPGHKRLHRPLDRERQQHGPHGRPRRRPALRLPRRPNGLQPESRTGSLARPYRAGGGGVAARAMVLCGLRV
ncbi:MAG: integral membrane rhomboid family serine protease MJ0610.1, partial [uncultured Rubrobacteraceae bacterium]